VLDKGRGEYYCEVFLYTDTHLLILDDISILDINLKEHPVSYNYKKTSQVYGIPDQKRQIIFKYDDVFFEYNLMNIDRCEYGINVLLYNKFGQFLQQIDILGENLIKSKNMFSFEYKQLSNNTAFSSINPKFGNAIDVYKKERLSYLRNVKIDNIIK
jgi:hypothetical protein